MLPWVRFTLATMVVAGSMWVGATGLVILAHILVFWLVYCGHLGSTIPKVSWIPLSRDRGRIHLEVTEAVSAALDAPGHGGGGLLVQSLASASWARLLPIVPLLNISELRTYYNFTKFLKLSVVMSWTNINVPLLKVLLYLSVTKCAVDHTTCSVRMWPL